MTDFAACAATLDANDPLAPTRDAFTIPDGLTYLDGNSLGLMPNGVTERLAHTAQTEWAQHLIKSWTDADWFNLPMTTGNRIALLIGVGQGEVAVTDSTSVNLFKCLAAGLNARPARKTILAERQNFPTDSYIAQGLAMLTGDTNLDYFDPDADLNIKRDTAVILLSHVDYRTAAIRDMAKINAAAHAAGALVLWDLCHSVGAISVDLTGTGADMAVGCTYKYLNGGPGAPAFAWINANLIEHANQPLTGWIGHAAPFDFTENYTPAPGARRLLSGTPQILSLSALDEALKIWETVDGTALFAKSRAMTSFFIEAVQSTCATHGLELVGPNPPTPRGSHVAFNHPNGFQIVQALIARNIVGDFRAPAMMRFGFAPLYLRFAEVWHAVDQLSDILNTRAWDDDKYRKRGAIT